MLTRLLRRRPLPGQVSGDPTLLALALHALTLAALFAVTVAGFGVLYPIGYDGLLAALLVAVLAWLVVGLRRRSSAAPSPLSPRWRWLGRIRAVARVLFMAVLTLWLGLLGWERLSPGGDPPPAKDATASIRVLTWNLHCGQTHGPVWLHFNWGTRRHALQTALHQAAPDILCVQEAVAEQVTFLETVLPLHRRVGVGRDDGKDAGEFCAIYFDERRFTEIDSGTFWLEEPIDRPHGGWPNVKRVCTWARLRDRDGGRVLRVYNSHSYLTDPARIEASRIILDHVKEGDATDAVIVTADFNAGPDAPSRRMFLDTGLADSATLAGKAVDTQTFQFHGVRLWNIDGILVNERWRVRRHQIVDVKPEGVFPSDHFGVLADLDWRK